MSSKSKKPDILIIESNWYCDINEKSKSKLVITINSYILSENFVFDNTLFVSNFIVS